MESTLSSSIILLDGFAFLLAILMHLTRRNANLVRLYVIQSLCLSVILLMLGFSSAEKSLLWMSLLTLFVKVIVAPVFFFRVLRGIPGAEMSATNYLSTPQTLLAIMGLVILSYSKIIIPIGVSTPDFFGLFSLNVAMVLTSIFLLINRRGIFTQIVGILCLENSIVLLSTIVGAKQPVGLEIGMLFDIGLWIVVALVFISMIHTQFGTLSTVPLKKLIEE